MIKKTLIIIAVVLSAACSGVNESQVNVPDEGKRRVITLDDSQEARPFSPAVEFKNTLYVSGQIGRVPETGRLAEGGIEAETRQVLENLKRVMEKAGYSLEDAVACTVLLTDMAHYSVMNQIYMEYFTDAPPARKAFAVKELPGGALIEIDAIACR